MKKTVFKLLCLLLVLTLSSLILPSCNIESRKLMKLDEQERAIEVYARVEQAMSGASSYKSYTDLDFSFGEIGKKYSMTGVIYETFHEDTSNGLYHLTKGQMSTTMQGYEEKKTSSYSEGYYDGKIFSCENGIGEYDDMTEDEYISYKNEDSDMNFEINDEFCDEKKCVFEGGLWSLEFSKLSSNSLIHFNRILSSLGSATGEDLTDVSIKMTVTDDFYIDEISMTFKFTSNHSTPTLTIKTRYDSINRVDADELENIDMSQYTHVPNFQAISKTQRAIQNTIVAEGIKFSMSVYQTASQNNYAVTALTTYSGVFFNSKTEGFSFNYTQKERDQSDYYVVEYANGTLKTVLKDSDGNVKEEDERAISPAKAYKTIMEFIDPMSFSILDIYNTDILTENYFDFDIDDSSSTILSSIYPGAYSTSSNLEVKLEDNIMSTYEYSAKGSIRISNGTASVEVRVKGKFTAISPSESI